MINYKKNGLYISIKCLKNMKLKNNTFTKYPFGNADVINAQVIDNDVVLNIKSTKTLVYLNITDDTEVFCNIPNYFDVGSELFIIIKNESKDSKVFFNDGFSGVDEIDSKLDDTLYINFIYNGIDFISFESLDYIKNKYQKYINHKSVEPFYSGSTDSGTITSLTDSSATWSSNQWVDKVIKIHKQGDEDDFEFAIISGNTSNTLFFDDDLIFQPCTLCIYKIIDTIVLNNDDLNTIIALNILNNDVGIILPKVDYSIERRYVNAYIERGNSGNTFVPLIGRGKDYQTGVKYGTLQYNGEGVSLYSHTWDSDDDETASSRPHWDIINLQGIQRMLTGYWQQDEQITSSTFQPYGAELKLEIDRTRRFLPIVRNGIKFFRYQSLIPRTFMVTWGATIFKNGGGLGEVEIVFGVRNQDSGLIEIQDNRKTKTRFDGGEGYSDIILRNPIDIGRNDEIVCMALRTSGNIFINGGSTLDIIEI